MALTQIDQLIQNAILSSPGLSDEYITWEVYKPTRSASNDFYKINIERDTNLLFSFMGSYPSQSPKVNSNTIISDAQPETIQTALFVVDVLSLPQPLSNKYLMKIQGEPFLYQINTEVGNDLLDKNIRLEVIRVL